MNLYAHTLPTSTRGYTGYVSVNRVLGGVAVTVRAHEDTTGASQTLVLTVAQAVEMATAILAAALRPEGGGDSHVPAEPAPSKGNG